MNIGLGTAGERSRASIGTSRARPSWACYDALRQDSNVFSRYL